MEATIANLTERLIAFRDERDWRQFHGLKNLLVALNLEAAELLELAQWKDDQAMEEALQDTDFRRRLAEEMADVFIYLLLIGEHSGIDLLPAAAAKIDQNQAKYPVEKSRGNSRRHSEL